jgi:Rrf2 family protein
MGIPCGMMHKVARVLKNAGIICERRGSTGGFELIKSVSDVSVLDIADAFEKTMRINRCLEADEYCSRNAAHNCVVNAFYHKVQNTLDELMSVKMSSLLEDA